MRTSGKDTSTLWSRSRNKNIKKPWEGVLSFIAAYSQVRKTLREGSLSHRANSEHPGAERLECKRLSSSGSACRTMRKFQSFVLFAETLSNRIIPEHQVSTGTV